MPTHQDPKAAAVRNVDGLETEGKSLHEKHPIWYPPTDAPITPLKVMNSLTETVMPFAAINGRVVKWYTCGPTVYDMSHMGHARAYLTFDIVRRVMEDYFGYSIEYQMNITDIDDKIIKRARVNKLVLDHKTETKDLEAAKKDVEAAVALAAKVLSDRAEKLAVPLPADAISRIVDERDEQVKMLELKQGQLNEQKAAIAAALETKDVAKYLDAAKSVLGEWLDSEKGHTITDHEIFNQHARKYEAEYFEDMHRLGIRDPDVVSRVTEVVPQVVDYVQKIIDNGFAYVAESSVFFDTEAFVAAGHKYPKNLPTAQNDAEEKNETTDDQMAEGEGALSAAKAGEKKSANDFALWKFSKPGEPAWPSPWGPGRPGWHIECSVMASEVLGENMDIHAGGCDLKFPHHDNELAQAEAFWGHHQWVNYFLHCGHLHIKGLKMSKSLKNFITIRQALDELHVTPRQMRLLFLSNAWHKPMNFSDQSLGEAREIERVLRAFFGRTEALLRDDFLSKPQGFNAADAALNKQLTVTDCAVHAALCDNIDTVTALAKVMELVKSANAYLDNGERVSATLIHKTARFVTRVLKVFGVIQGSDDVGFNDGDSQDSKFTDAVDSLVSFRDDVRAAARDKDFAAVVKACDKVRDESMVDLGVNLWDGKIGESSKWCTDSRENMIREREEKLAAAAAKERQKIVNQLEKAERMLAKWKPYVAPPAGLFKSKPEFQGDDVEFDERGVPTKVKGAAVEEKAAKKLTNEFNTYKKIHDELHGKKGGAEYVAGLQAEVDGLKAKLA